MLTEPIVQLDATYSGPAYEYLLPSDGLPVYAAMPEDPLCRVKLFMPEGRFTYYVAALTRYAEGLEGLVVSGWCVSALGSDCDEFGDSNVAELLALRSPTLGLPIERDVSWGPAPLSAVRRLL